MSKIFYIYADHSIYNLHSELDIHTHTYTHAQSSDKYVASSSVTFPQNAYPNYPHEVPQ